jgi:hypothetical protein
VAVRHYECLHCVLTALCKENVHASSEWNILTLNSCRGCTFVKKKESFKAIQKRQNTIYIKKYK